MICPYCKSDNSYVKTTRPVDGTVARKRMCKGCCKIFFTREIIVSDEEGKELINLFQKNYLMNK